MSEPPDPCAAATLRDLAAQLQALRQWAGQPSLRRLRQLGGVRVTADGSGEIDSLPETTLSYVLRGARPPRADFVRSFVTACLRARRWEASERSAYVERWHQAWLAASGHGQRPAPDPRVSSRVVPRQLPPTTTDFTGRESALAVLDALLPDPADSAAPPAMAAVTGPAGVGKTTLAVHWAHRVAHRFPDGQLYLNLRGFDPGRPPMEPDAAVRTLLHALDVPLRQIPADVDAQIGLYRSQLAGRRMLLILDNAAGSGQVRPLLPGAPGCLAVVTSRDQLAGLVAAEGAQPVALDLLASHEARQLLERRLGADRLAAEPDATDQLVSQCAGLPLALVVVAARALTRPRVPIRELVRELRDAQPGLDGWREPDPVVDVRAALDVSYRTLSPLAARLFRWLSLHPGPDVSIAAAASLLGEGVGPVRAPLAELTTSHMVRDHVAHRYHFHDLLRAHASERARREDSAEVRQGAYLRMVDFYLHSACAAALCVNPHRARITIDPPAAATAPERFTDVSHAMGWFSQELPVLVALVEETAKAGLDRYCWRLAWTLSDLLQRSNRWHEWRRCQTTALAAADRMADVRARAYSHRQLGGAGTFLRTFEDAHAHLLEALRCYRELGERVWQARVHIDISVVLTEQGRHRDGLAHAHQAAELCRAEGDAVGRASALNGAGWMYAQLGEYEPALDYCRQALELQQRAGERYRQASTWDSLGYVYQHLGRHREATDCYHQAILLAREQRDRHLEATALTHLGDNYRAAGDDARARQVWQDALAILRELADPDVGELQAKLVGLGPADPGTAAGVAR